MNLTSIRRRVATAAAGLGLLALAACGASTASDTDTAASASSLAVPALSTPAETHADADDGEYDTSEATTITLADGASEVSGSGAAVEGDVVTVSAPGTYVVSGSLSDGQLVVNSTADGKVRLVLDGVSITSSTTSPLVVTQSDETVVILADGSTNTLSDAAASGDDDETEDAPNATLFSQDDLTIAGTGELSVTGLSNDGIASKDGLVILSGDITVKASDDGIRGKDYVVFSGGTATVTAGGDGLKSDNDDAAEPGWVQVDAGTITLDAGSDGVDAIGAVYVTDGSLTVSKSEEGLEAAAIDIAGGTVDVTSTDDGLNATYSSSDESTDAAEGSAAEDSAGQGGEMPQGERPSGAPEGGMPEGGEMPEGGGMPGGGGGGGMGGDQSQDGVLLTISGGTTHISAGGDGFDSNGAAEITGGTILIDGPAQGGNGSIDVNGDFDVTGGTLVAAGTSSMAVTPAEDSEQGWVAASVSASAGQLVAIADSDGTVVAAYVVEQDSQLVTASTDGIKLGEEYDVYVGDASSATGYSTDVSLDGLTKSTTVTANEYAGGGMGG